MFRCYLPLALLAEWPASFTWHCSNTGVEWTLNKESARKVDSGKENSPAAPATHKVVCPWSKQVGTSPWSSAPVHCKVFNRQLWCFISLKHKFDNISLDLTDTCCYKLPSYVWVVKEKLMSGFLASEVCKEGGVGKHHTAQKWTVTYLFLFLFFFYWLFAKHIDFLPVMQFWAESICLFYWFYLDLNCETY